MWRKVSGVRYVRERIDTWDNDFLDLDWSKIGSRKLVLITHGMEGNTYRQYVRGMVKAANTSGYDALAWNLRGCSGEPNNLITAYHSGKTDDLDFVLKHVLANNNYDSISLVGISLGGNLTLKYLGEGVYPIPSEVSAAVVVSVPCDLVKASRHIISGWNRMYSRRFLKQCLDKVRTKMHRFPDAIDYDHVMESDTLLEFTHRFTAPLHGYTDADHYHEDVMCKQFISGIKLPTLLINAENDPFLTPESFPLREAEKSRHFTLEITRNGGHVGFDEFMTFRSSWLEQRVMGFFNEVSSETAPSPALDSIPG
jgi:predicted alpha/beta-fold hydrolase